MTKSAGPSRWRPPPTRAKGRSAAKESFLRALKSFARSTDTPEFAPLFFKEAEEGRGKGSRSSKPALWAATRTLAMARNPPPDAFSAGAGCQGQVRDDERGWRQAGRAVALPLRRHWRRPRMGTGTGEGPRAWN